MGEVDPQYAFSTLSNKGLSLFGLFWIEKILTRKE